MTSGYSPPSVTSDEGKVVRHDEQISDQEDEETILVVGQWQYIGRGHSPGEAIYARTIAHDLSENRRLARHIRSEHEDSV